MRLISMSVDPETKQASLSLMFSFTGKFGHVAQHNNEALYSLTFVTQIVDLVRSSFVIKDCQAENLNLLVKLEQGNLDVPDYTRKFNDYHIVFGNLKFPKNLEPICILWVSVLDL